MEKYMLRQETEIRNHFFLALYFKYNSECFRMCIIDSFSNLIKEKILSKPIKTM